MNSATSPGGDTAALAKAMRRLMFLHQMRARVGPLWRWFFTAYAHVYALAAAPASRAAELRADDLSVRVAGPKVAKEALRSVVRTDLAWDLANEHYLPLFERAGKRASLTEALRAIIAANPQIEPAVDQVLATDTPAASDTHPPLRERIARFESAGGDGIVDARTDDQVAISLLGGGADWLNAAEGKLLVQDWPLASWPEVVSAGVRESIAADADALGANMRQMSLGSGNLASVLKLVDEQPDGAVSLIGGEEPDAREITIASVVTSVMSALLSSGAARVQPSWNEVAHVALADGDEPDLEERVGAAVDAADSSGLRTWLAEVGVDVEMSRAPSARPRWLAAISQMTGPWKGRRDVHLWSTGVLALPRLDKRVVKEAKNQFSEAHQHPRLYGDAAAGLEAGRALDGALWWEAANIVNASVGGRLKSHFRFELRDDTVFEITSTLESATVDSINTLVEAVLYLGSPDGDTPATS